MIDKKIVNNPFNWTYSDMRSGFTRTQLFYTYALDKLHFILRFARKRYHTSMMRKATNMLISPLTSHIPLSVACCRWQTCNKHELCCPLTFPLLWKTMLRFFRPVTAFIQRKISAEPEFLRRTAGANGWQGRDGTWQDWHFYVSFHPILLSPCS